MRPSPACRKSNACSGWPHSHMTKLVTSTTLLMGRMPATRSRCCSHAGDGPTATSRNTARGVAGAEVGRLNRRPTSPHPAGSGSSSTTTRGSVTRAAGQRRHFPGHADDRQAVGPVRVHFQVHDDVVQPEALPLAAGRRRTSGGQQPNAAGVVAHAQLRFGAQHALRRRRRAARRAR